MTKSQDVQRAGARPNIDYIFEEGHADGNGLDLARSLVFSTQIGWILAVSLRADAILAC